MGMFDELRCHYPLEGGGNSDDVFQTKDTDAQRLEMYQITHDGRLFDQNGKDTCFHGELNFYTSNTCGVRYDQDSGEAWVMTTNDEPYRALDYVAKFVSGQIVEVAGGPETLHTNTRHVTRKEWWDAEKKA